MEKSVIRHPVPSPERYNWRNKIRLAVENGICGYRGEDNRTLIPVTSCQLVNAEINRFLAEMDIPESGSIELRYTPANGVVRLDESNCQELIFDNREKSSCQKSSSKDLEKNSCQKSSSKDRKKSSRYIRFSHDQKRQTCGIHGLMGLLP